MPFHQLRASREKLKLFWRPSTHMPAVVEKSLAAFFPKEAAYELSVNVRNAKGGIVKSNARLADPFPSV